MKKPKPIVVLVWGDSIAASGWPALAERYFNVVLNTGRPVRVINKGVPGLCTTGARQLFEKSVMSEKADLVIMQFGLNDARHAGTRGQLPLATPAEFEENLCAMVREVRVRMKACVVLFGNHATRSFLRLPTGLTYDKARACYNAASRRVGLRERVPYHDMSKVLAALGLEVREVVNDDGVHLSPLGQRAYAQFAANLIREMLDHTGGYVTGKIRGSGQRHIDAGKTDRDLS